MLSQPLNQIIQNTALHAQQHSQRISRPRAAIHALPRPLTLPRIPRGRKRESEFLNKRLKQPLNLRLPRNQHRIPRRPRRGCPTTRRSIRGRRTADDFRDGLDSVVVVLVDFGQEDEPAGDDGAVEPAGPGVAHEVVERGVGRGGEGLEIGFQAAEYVVEHCEAARREEWRGSAGARGGRPEGAVERDFVDPGIRQSDCELEVCWGMLACISKSEAWPSSSEMGTWCEMLQGVTERNTYCSACG